MLHAYSRSVLLTHLSLPKREISALASSAFSSLYYNIIACARSGIPDMIPFLDSSYVRKTHRFPGCVHLAEHSVYVRRIFESRRVSHRPSVRPSVADNALLPPPLPIITDTTCAYTTDIMQRETDECSRHHLYQSTAVCIKRSRVHITYYELLLLTCIIIVLLHTLHYIIQVFYDYNL